MNKRLLGLVRRRAGERCEYCQLPQAVSGLRFSVDHIIARQHGGQTGEQNLALACNRCNLFKGPNLTGIDPNTGVVTRLYHPRRDQHFRWNGISIVGTTGIGRTTVRVLNVNETSRLSLRQALRDAADL